MNNELEDAIEEISTEVQMEWKIGKIFYGLYRTLTIEIIKRLEARKWRYPPEYPDDDREVIIAFSFLDWEGKVCTVTEVATYYSRRWLHRNTEPMDYGDRVYAWREWLDAPPLPKPAPMLEAGQGGGDDE